jgi:hypothetical protein
MDIKSLIGGGAITLTGWAPALSTSWANLNVFASDIDWKSIFASAAKLDITSSSASDTSAGTGAQKVMVVGCDASYKPLVEIVTMNGQTAVTTANAFLRVFAMQVYACGSGAHGANLGDIYAVKTGSSAWTAGVPNTLTSAAVKVPATIGTATSGIWTVPAGDNVQYRAQFLVAGARSQVATLGIFTNNLNDGQGAAWSNDLLVEMGSGAPAALQLDPDISSDWTRHGGSNLQWGTGTDIYLRAIGGAAGTYITANLTLRRMG